MFRSRIAHHREVLGSFVVGAVVFEIISRDWDSRQAETFFAGGDRKAEKSLSGRQEEKFNYFENTKLRLRWISWTGASLCSFIRLSRHAARLLLFSALSQWFLLEESYGREVAQRDGIMFSQREPWTIPLQTAKPPHMRCTTERFRFHTFSLINSFI